MRAYSSRFLCFIWKKIIMMHVNHKRSEGTAYYEMIYCTCSMCLNLDAYDKCSQFDFDKDGGTPNTLFDFFLMVGYVWDSFHPPAPFHPPQVKSPRDLDDRHCSVFGPWPAPSTLTSALTMTTTASTMIHTRRQQEGVQVACPTQLIYPTSPCRSSHSHRSWLSRRLCRIQSTVPSPGTHTWKQSTTWILSPRSSPSWS